jgi:hypothetical protein
MSTQGANSRLDASLVVNFLGPAVCKGHARRSGMISNS